MSRARSPRTLAGGGSIKDQKSSDATRRLAKRRPSEPLNDPNHCRSDIRGDGEKDLMLHYWSPFGWLGSPVPTPGMSPSLSLPPSRFQTVWTTTSMVAIPPRPARTQTPMSE